MAKGKVNGIVYDFASIRVRVPVGLSVTFTEIDYDNKKPVEVKHNNLGEPRGQTRGNFEGTFKIVASLDEFEKLNESVKDTGPLGADPMPVTVIYGADGEKPVTDELEVKIESTKRIAKTGTDEVMQEIVGKQTKIPLLNGIPAYVVPEDNA